MRITKLATIFDVFTGLQKHEYSSVVFYQVLASATLTALSESHARAQMCAHVPWVSAGAVSQRVRDVYVNTWTGFIFHCVDRTSQMSLVFGEITTNGLVHMASSQKWLRKEFLNIVFTRNNSWKVWSIGFKRDFWRLWRRDRYVNSFCGFKQRANFHFLILKKKKKIFS